jgi:hypothetical protein
MEYLNPYFELWYLKNADRNKFLQLTALVLVERIFQVYIGYILFSYSSMFVFLLFMCQSELFFSLYFVNLLYSDWIQRTIQESVNMSPKKYNTNDPQEPEINLQESSDSNDLE